MVRFDHRKGTSLSLAFEVTENGAAVTVTSWTVACTLRDLYGMYSFSPTVALATNVITLSATASQTSNFPVGTLRGHLVVTIAGVSYPSETFELEVLRA